MMAFLYHFWGRVMKDPLPYKESYSCNIHLSNEKQLFTNGAAPEHSKRQPMPSPDVSLKTGKNKMQLHLS